MNNQTIIKQLEKALECKELKEMKMRVEVLVDILKESGAPVYQRSQSPVQPLPPNTVNLPYQEPKVAGAGAIVSANSEQITYTRPEGT